MKDREGPGEDDPEDPSPRLEGVTPFRPSASRPGFGGRNPSPENRSVSGGARPHSLPPRGGGPGDLEDVADDLGADDDLERLTREAQHAAKIRRDKALKVEKTRRRFFVGAAFWGFLAGWLAVPLGLYTIGHRVQVWRPRAVIATILLLVLCWIGARLINKFYRDVRLRGR